MQGRSQFDSWVGRIPWRRDRLPTAVFLGSVFLVAQTVKNHLQCRTSGFNLWVGKIHWRRAWQPTPVFLPGESPWTDKPGGLHSMGSQRVRHNWATKHKNQLALGFGFHHLTFQNPPFSYLEKHGHYPALLLGRLFGKHLLRYPEKNCCKDRTPWELVNILISVREDLMIYLMLLPSQSDNGQLWVDNQGSLKFLVARNRNLFWIT